MRLTFGGQAFGSAAPTPGNASVLLVGTGVLTFSAKPALTASAQFGGHGRLGIPGQLETDTVAVRAMAITSGILAPTQRYALQAELEPSAASIARSGMFPSGAM